jgi:hypothetical protein
MKYPQFEARTLELLFKTDVKLVVQQVAFRVGCTVDEAKKFLDQMASAGTLTMEVDDDGVIYYDIPGRPPPTGEPLSWAVSNADPAPPGPKQMALQHVPVAPVPSVVTAREKSVGAAVVLALLFGPLGMMYSTIAGGLIMMLLTLIVVPATMGFGFLLLWPIEVIWAALAASAQNKRYQQELYAAAAYQHQLHTNMQMQMQAVTALAANAQAKTQAPQAPPQEAPTDD